MVGSYCRQYNNHVKTAEVHSSVHATGLTATLTVTFVPTVTTEDMIEDRQQVYSRQQTRRSYDSSKYLRSVKALSLIVTAHQAELS